MECVLEPQLCIRAALPTAPYRDGTGKASLQVQRAADGNGAETARVFPFSDKKKLRREVIHQADYVGSLGG